VRDLLRLQLRLPLKIGGEMPLSSSMVIIMVPCHCLQEHTHAHSTYSIATRDTHPGGPMHRARSNRSKKHTRRESIATEKNNAFIIRNVHQKQQSISNELLLLNALAANHPTINGPWRQRQHLW